MSALQQRSDGGVHVLFDADLITAPDAAFFDHARWRAGGAVLAEAAGRGAACIFSHGGRTFVLRHYRRGGLAARISADRYLWTGLERTRAWREWKLLAWMHAEELPVPRPVAARVQRLGGCYRADLVTLYLQGTVPLADALAGRALSKDEWRGIGAAIARLHRARVCHADLNARNILLGESGEVHLIDFDRARRRAAGGWREANLARLRRSLDKFMAADGTLFFEDADWRALVSGYGAAFGADSSQGASASR